jgi:threonylcarbamoyladenosine tRNA methylthiotransferase MtaB
MSRIRLSSLDPREVSDRLLDLMASSDSICAHLHICAQAGDDAILKAMRRNYDTAYYRELLARVRQRMPEAALGSDIIVGFPGESDGQFEASLEYFDDLPLTYFHVFPYSPRRGTVATTLPDAVPAPVKKLRAQWMRDLGARKKQEFCAGFTGQRMAVLVEGEADDAGGSRRGFSRNYLPVALAGAGVAPNREVTVRLGEYRNGWLRGVIDTPADEGNLTATVA